MAVAPLVGAWIEIDLSSDMANEVIVAPLVGAWIEIDVCPICEGREWIVAPLVGAWIEISHLLIKSFLFTLSLLL